MIQDSVTCDFCYFSFLSSLAQDRREHDKYHDKCLKDYEQTSEKFRNKEITWFRPEVENAGVYLALNELNPRLTGFSYSGISEKEWNSIRQGKSTLPIGTSGGNGHDRHGEWVSLDGLRYTYHANWRSGHIHFWRAVE